MSKYHQGDATYPVALSLKIKNVKESKFFYTEILGFSILEEHENHIYYTINGQDIILKTFIDPMASLRRPSQGLYHVAYLFNTQEALAQVIQNIAKHKYPITGAADHGVSDALYLDDPDGNGIELYYDTNPTYWSDIDQYPSKIENKPFNYNFYLQLKVKPLIKIDSKTILGHMHLHSADLPKASIFYQKVLDYQMIVNVGSAHFLSSVEYHHHLALNTWAGTLKPKADAVGLMDVTYQVGSDARFNHIIEQLKALNMPYELDGNNLYTVDPDGVKLILKK